MKKPLLTLLLVLSAATGLCAQKTAPAPAANDSTPALSKKELRKQRVARRNFHYNILGGPSYSPDFGLLIGGSALMTFSLQPSDTTLKRSVVPMAIAFMFDGGINLFSKPQLFFKGDKFRIFGKFSYKNTQENYYGIGYSTNKDYVRSDTTSQYRYSGVQINPWFLFRLGRSNFFAGPQVDINYDHFTKPGKWLAEEPSYQQAGGDGHGYKNFNAGLGFLLTYDSRDVPSNAYRGVYLDFRGMMYHKIFGSDHDFYRLELDYRQYKQLGRRKVLAWTAQSKNVFGRDIPRGPGGVSPNVQHGQGQLAAAHHQPPGLRGVGRMRLHGPQPRTDRRRAAQLRRGTAHRGAAPHERPPGPGQEHGERPDAVLLQHDRGVLTPLFPIHGDTPRFIGPVPSVCDVHCAFSDMTGFTR